METAILDMASPSERELWHPHLTHTRDYWQQFCPRVLQTDLHHQPGTGGPDEKARFQDQYATTLDLYRRHFGSTPGTFWSVPSNVSEQSPSERLNLEDLDGNVSSSARAGGLGAWVWVLSFSVIVGTFFILLNDHNRRANPLQWAGPSSLLILSALLLVCAVLAPRLRWLGRVRVAGASMSTWSIWLAERTALRTCR